MTQDHRASHGAGQARPHAFHSLLVPVDLSAAMGRVLPPPRPHVGWVHAYDAPYHGLSYPSLAPEQGRADLLLLGTHGRAGLAHALLGTVAGDVLRDVQCDVLVVPPRRQGARKR
jgi:hypothetical protein